jgi:hypothetical protein
MGPENPVVMPWLDHGIHSVALAFLADPAEWIAGSSPAMTTMNVGGKSQIQL